MRKLRSSLPRRALRRSAADDEGLPPSVGAAASKVPGPARVKVREPLADATTSLLPLLAATAAGDVVEDGVAATALLLMPAEAAKSFLPLVAATGVGTSILEMAVIPPTLALLLQGSLRVTLLKVPSLEGTDDLRELRGEQRGEDPRGEKARGEDARGELPGDISGLAAKEAGAFLISWIVAT